MNFDTTYIRIVKEKKEDGKNINKDFFKQSMIK
jgi:hypothetical protein